MPKMRGNFNLDMGGSSQTRGTWELRKKSVDNRQLGKEYRRERKQSMKSTDDRLLAEQP